MFGLMTVARHLEGMDALDAEWEAEVTEIRKEANLRVEQWRTLAMEALADLRVVRGFAPPVGEEPAGKASVADGDAKAVREAREKANEARRTAGAR